MLKEKERLPNLGHKQTNKQTNKQTTTTTTTTTHRKRCRLGMWSELGSEVGLGKATLHIPDTPLHSGTGRLNSTLHCGRPRHYPRTQPKIPLPVFKRRVKTQSKHGVRLPAGSTGLRKPAKP